MLNYVWSFLLLTGLIAGALFGRLETMVSGVFDVCKSVVMSIALPLAGVMMLWLGILRVMEKAGLMEVVARALSPILRFIFPDVPKDHPAMGAITMNIAANMLGLGNSATPMGLKAMGHLQELNPHKQSASNAMCMFLALNTAGFSLIPMSAINYLNSGGVANPQAIIAPTILATLCATVMGIMAAKFFQRLPVFRQLPDEVSAPGETPGAPADPAAAARVYRPSTVRKVFICLAAVGFLFGAALQLAPSFRQQVLQTTGMTQLLDAAAKKKEMTEARKAAMQTASPEASAKPATEESW